MLAHQLAGLDGHVEIAANVHVDGFLEGRYVSVQHMAELRVGGGVVDRDVEAAELLADLREHRLNLLQLANVAGHRGGLSASRDDGVGYRLATFDLAAGHDYVGALLGEQFCDRLADTAAGAGNEGDLAV